MERRKYRKHRFMKVLAFILTVIVMWKLIGNVGSWVRQWQSDEEYGVSAQNMSIHDAKEKAPQKLQRRLRRDCTVWLRRIRPI